MKFNDHSNLIGQHSILSASKYYWVNYDVEKFRQYYTNMLAVERGTRLHEYAAESIRLGLKRPRTKKTLDMYVNDALGYGMRPEQPLYYSPFAFGTTDAISFDNGKLRIHDYKSGVTPAHMEQLMIYAAYFCLEYKIKPIDISMALRIYQNNEINEYEPMSADILPIMDKIIAFDKEIVDIRGEAL